MNLYERFWKSIDELRESPNGAPPAVEIQLTPVHPPDGVQSEAAKDLTAIVARAPRRFPPFVATQPNVSTRPFCLIYTVARPELLPQFHELFEHYVDKNAFVAEALLRLRPHCDIPYILFLGDKSFFLYDALLEELLRWGSDYAALEEALVQPLISGDSISKFWDSIQRKTCTQRSEEFGRWLDLWKVGIGARTSATPAFMQLLMQKVVLLFMYDLHFGLQEAELALRENFLDQRPVAKRLRPTQMEPVPFDGVAWLHQASGEVVNLYEIDFLRWTNAESHFFALMGAETRLQFSQFILELFLLSTAKLQSAVQADAFSDANSKLKLWKFSVTETINIRRRLQADDVNVYEPIWIDLEESGIGWALHVIQETLEFWRERCTLFEKQLAEQRQLKVQFDMFQQPDLEHARVPVTSDIFDAAFTTSVRIFYDFPAERATLEYLVILKAFEFCRQWGSPLRPLGQIGEMFIQKERLVSLQGT
ncbi:MAG: hypothetical protein ACR2IE_11785 [Candidatus Sumerlaeaceae bacterium]